MGTESSIGLLSGILWFVQGLFYSLVNLFTALSNPQLWLDWSDKQALMRFIYYGGSTELFFVFLLFFIIIVLAGVLNMASCGALCALPKAFPTPWGDLLHGLAS